MTALTHAEPTPFDSTPIEEIPLERAQLRRVVAQVRYEPLGVFKRENFISPLIDRLVDRFPLLEEGHETELIFGPSGISQKDSPNPLWRLHSIDRIWTITVSPGSLAIETSAYESRTDFISRFEGTYAAFVETIGSSPVLRLGIRYTNQILDESVPLEQLITFFRPDVRGALGINLGDSAVLRHAINDALFVANESYIQGKWGLLPPSAVFDPSISPVPYQSWFLDIDSFADRDLPMEPSALANQLEQLSDKAYRLFRWLVAPEFIDRYRAA